jgi:hypothetical protein
MTLLQFSRAGWFAIIGAAKGLTTMFGTVGPAGGLIKLPVLRVKPRSKRSHWLPIFGFCLGAILLFMLILGRRADPPLFVDYDPNWKFNALDLVDIKFLLEDSLGLEVDVTTRDSLHPMLRDDIEKSAVRVF